MLGLVLQVAFVVASVSQPAAGNLPAGTNAYQTAAKPGHAGLFGAKLTMEKFKALKTGMTYKQVVKIVGFEGAEDGRSSIAGIETVSYSWQNMGGATMMVMFQNGKLMMKNQAGLD